ncbi:hypothetical protein SAZ_21770 [Streptomyces noursei ZPM]|uniref:Uncharacterized protein n=2 Tax=Streptomyces noursei TaxID=1971 RepID=A0A059VYX1_STRNR|nr:hypothetical protein DC74_4082 [Streptomyces noursei]AKA04787.1 hypothetical protein SAZ_21770 [Streptomyces noursei ZPM]EOT05400.1 hypothetical protein K530_03724 [Streptomyces noursei CCRC 11814]GCB92175.1 hypothetical protein SALB_04934 [Streptomyces noursei]
MKKLMQTGTVVGACGLVLFGTGVARAQTDPGDSLLSAVAGADVGTVTGMVSGVVCDNRLADFNYQSPATKSPHPCVNGPVHSGNSKNSNNFLNHGNPVDSGNIETASGSTNSLNTVYGAQKDSNNNISRILKVLH